MDAICGMDGCGSKEIAGFRTVRVHANGEKGGADIELSVFVCLKHTSVSAKEILKWFEG